MLYYKDTDIKTVLLDMDGVIADFIGGACKAHGKESPYLHEANLGKWDIDKIWGMSPEEFWEPLNSVEFWRCLDKTDEADYIVSALVGIYSVAGVAICTRPPDSFYGGAVDGKRQWIARHYPDLLDNMIFCVDKSLCAGREILLVDDNDMNVRRFEDNGGNSFLVPRPWNSSWGLSSSNDIKRRLDIEINRYNLG